MNPWDIVSWIGAASIATLLITLTTTMVKSALRPTKRGSRTIYDSSKHD